MKSDKPREYIEYWQLKNVHGDILRVEAIHAQPEGNKDKLLQVVEFSALTDLQSKLDSLQKIYEFDVGRLTDEKNGLHFQLDTTIQMEGKHITEIEELANKLDVANAKIHGLNHEIKLLRDAPRWTAENLKSDADLKSKLDAAVLALEEISNGRHWPTRYDAEDISREGLIEIARETLAKIGEK